MLGSETAVPSAAGDAVGRALALQGTAVLVGGVGVD